MEKMRKTLICFLVTVLTLGLLFASSDNSLFNSNAYAEDAEETLVTEVESQLEEANNSSEENKDEIDNTDNNSSDDEENKEINGESEVESLDKQNENEDVLPNETPEEQPKDNDTSEEYVEDNNNLEQFDEEIELPVVDGEPFDDTPIEVVIDYNIMPETDFLINTLQVNRIARRVLRNANLPVIGVNHPTAPGEVMLFKEATPVPGMVNTWDIKVRIEGKDKPVTSDIVLVIDTSGSMNDNGRLIAAKDAANAFVNTLLQSGSSTALTTRISVVTFDYYANTKIGLTNNKTSLNSVINAITANGGTFTQDGIKTAESLLANSNADFKHIVLLSDGQPTYSYAINSPNSYLSSQYISGSASTEGSTGVHTVNGNRWATTTNVPKTAFTNTRVGAGTRMFHRYDNPWGTTNDKYYNHGNSTIAQAGFAKNAGYIVWTIALEAGTEGTPVLNAVASPGHSFTSDPTQLQGIFQNIAGQISSAVQEASVVDPMGEGFIIPLGEVSNITSNPTTPAPVYNQNSKTISWNPGTLTTLVPGYTDVRYAEMTYRVEINDDILSATPDGDYYSTNGRTVVNYTDSNGTSQTAEFTSPKVDPILLIVEKELYDSHGNKITSDNREFTINITNNGDYNKTYVLKAGQKKVMTNLRLEDTYTVTETATGGLPSTALSDYDTVINIYGSNTNTFKINQNDPDSSVLVKNYEKPLGELTITKLFDNAISCTDSQSLNTGSENIKEYEFNVRDGSGNNLKILNNNGTAVVDDNGSEIVKVKAGESVVISGLPYDTYEVIEINNSGYNTSYSPLDGKATLSITNKKGTVTVTNSPIIKCVDVSVNKVWVDDSNSASTRPTNLELTLKANGQDYKNITITGNSNTWSQTLNLNKFDNNGNEIIWTIEEKVVPTNYVMTLSQDELTVTNTLKGNATISKIVDGELGDKNKPFVFKVTVKRNDEEVFTKSFDLKDSQNLNLADEFPGLLIGDEVVVGETDVTSDGYDTSVEVVIGADSNTLTSTLVNGYNQVSYTVGAKPIEIRFTNTREFIPPTALFRESMPYIFIVLIGLFFALSFLKKRQI